MLCRARAFCHLGILMDVPSSVSTPRGSGIWEISAMTGSHRASPQKTKATRVTRGGKNNHTLGGQQYRFTSSRICHASLGCLNEFVAI
eukprot:s1161_g9.t1